MYTNFNKYCIEYKWVYELLPNLARESKLFWRCLQRSAFIYSYWATRFRQRRLIEENLHIDPYLLKHIAGYVAPEGDLGQYFRPLEEAGFI